MKVVLTSLDTAFLPISRSRFKQREISMLITINTDCIKVHEIVARLIYLYLNKHEFAR